MEWGKQRQFKFKTKLQNPCSYNQPSLVSKWPNSPKFIYWNWMSTVCVTKGNRFSSVAQLCLTLQPHGLQHTRLLCPSPTPRVYSNSCPSSWWCHPTISSSVIPFPSSLQSLPASESFQMSQFFASGNVLEFQLQHQSFQWIFRTNLL